MSVREQIQLKQLDLKLKAKEENIWHKINILALIVGSMIIGLVVVLYILFRWARGF